MRRTIRYDWVLVLMAVLEAAMRRLKREPEPLARSNR